MAEEKPFEATPRRLERAKNEGQVAKSTHFSSLLGALVLVGATIWSIPFIFLALRASLQCGEARSIEPWMGGLMGLCVVFGTSIVSSLAGVVGEVLQVGFGCRGGPTMAPQWSRISPTEGCKRWRQELGQSWLFGLRVLAFSAAGLGMLVSTVSFWLQQRLPAEPGVRWHYGAVMQEMLGTWAIYAGCAWAAAAILEYWIRRRSFLRELRMSFDEYRREIKDSEGDPLVRGFRRALREQLALQDIVHRVRSSQVVVVARSDSMKRGGIGKS
jgi:type III secretion protein U